MQQMMRRASQPEAPKPAKWTAESGGKNRPEARSVALTAGGTSGSTAAAYKVTAADDIASRANAEPWQVCQRRSG